MKEIRNWIIFVLVAFMIIAGIIVGKAVKRYLADIELLRYDKNRLEMQIIDRENKIKVLQGEEKKKEARIDSCMVEFIRKDKIIAAYEKELSEALAQLNGISNDSIYNFLQKIAYNFPNDSLQYLFGKIQIRHINADWLRARNAEKEIPVFRSMIENCKLSFLQRDSLANSLRGVVALQQANLDDCQKINQANEEIIGYQDKTIQKERNRKNFWRIVSFAEPPLIFLLIALL